MGLVEQGRKRTGAGLEGARAGSSRIWAAGISEGAFVWDQEELSSKGCPWGPTGGLPMPEGSPLPRTTTGHL